jgi:N-acetylmuramoyl-L-alanine amidase
MKKFIITFILVLSVISAVISSAAAISLTVNDQPVSVGIVLRNGTSYVPLRATTNLLVPSAKVMWENGQAVVRSSNLTMTASPDKYYVEANGRMLYVKDGVKVENGTTLVPVRVLAKALGATVEWDGASGIVSLKSGSGTILPEDQFYDSDSVYWLSRIINAESQTEPLAGKIAVGNVILNRVASPDFPNSIYGVIFDTKFGVQFEPTKNGTINNTPSADSVLAAKLCLDGASVVGSSLYFLNPTISTSYWIMENRSLVSTIGDHKFYA